MNSLIRRLRSSDALPEKSEPVQVSRAKAPGVGFSVNFSTDVLPWVCLSATLASVFDAGPNILAQTTIAVVFICAAVASIAGFAFSALAGALLFHLHVDPVATIELLLIASISIQTFGVWTIRHTIEVGTLAPYLAGGLLTIPAGVYLLLSLHTQLFVPLLGCFLVLYGCYALVNPRFGVNCDGPFMRVLVGGLGAFTGAMAAFPGAFIAIWCNAQGMEKQRQRAIVQPYILIMQLVTLALISSFKPIPSFRLDHLKFVAPAILGAYIGLSLYARLNTMQFNRIVTLLLLVSGVILVSNVLVR